MRRSAGSARLTPAGSTYIGWRARVRAPLRRHGPWPPARQRDRRGPGRRGASRTASRSAATALVERPLKASTSRSRDGRPRSRDCSVSLFEMMTSLGVRLAARRGCCRGYYGPPPGRADDGSPRGKCRSAVRISSTSAVSPIVLFARGRSGSSLSALLQRCSARRRPAAAADTRFRDPQVHRVYRTKSHRPFQRVGGRSSAGAARGAGNLLQRRREGGIRAQRFFGTTAYWLRDSRLRVRARELVIELRASRLVARDGLFETHEAPVRFEPCCTCASARYSSFSGVEACPPGSSSRLRLDIPHARSCPTPVRGASKSAAGLRR